MFKFNRNKTDCNTIKYEFENSNNSKLTFVEFIHFLKSENKEFLKTFREALNNATDELSAYFWECVPVSQKNINKSFEFVLTKSEALNNITQDPGTFSNILADAALAKKQVSSFPNKGKNAILVIPSSDKNGVLDYKNISQFTKNASLEQQSKFWQEVANKLLEELEKSEAPKWLSTHGLGVHYLHVRIDNYPKYYSWEEYKNESNLPAPSNPDKNKQNNGSQVSPPMDDDPEKLNSNHSPVPSNSSPAEENPNNSNSKPVTDTKKTINSNTNSPKNASNIDTSPNDNKSLSILLTLFILLSLGIVFVSFLVWKKKR